MIRLKLRYRLALMKFNFHNTKCLDFSLIRQMVLGDIFTILLSFKLHYVIFLHKHTCFCSRTSHDVRSVILLVMRDAMSNDHDPIETAEWIDAFDSVCRSSGKERASFF